MTFVAAVGWSLLRAGIVTLLGTPAAVRMAAVLRYLPPRSARWCWIGLLLPCFTPSLVTGYCYRDTSLALVHHPWLKELLYALIVAAQALPVAVLLLWFAPPSPVTDSALHCRKLLQPRGVNALGLWLQARARSQLAAAAALFLLVFQEADLAALMQATGWTEWLFTRHALGLNWRESMRLAAIPMLVQLPALLPIWLWIRTPGRVSGEDQSVRSVRVGQVTTIAVRSWILVGLVIVFGIPGVQLIRGARQGWPALIHQRSTWEEIGDAGWLAVVAGALAIGVAQAFVLRDGKTGRPAQKARLLAKMALLVPGLLGNLALGIVGLAIFQTPMLRWAYESPLPLVLGEAVMVLPRTVILLCCVARLRGATADHQLTLLSRSADRGQRRSAAEIAWRTRGRAWLAIWSLVTFWIFLEVMLPSLLAPPGMAPVGLVLYNSLHYGRISALGAKLVLAFSVPLGLTCGFLLVRPLLFRSR